jgi:hypothetical protein
MKTNILLTFIALFYMIAAQATNTLYFQDPKQTWRREQGTIEMAVLSIKPQGNYLEYELSLTFAAHTYTSVHDTLEVQLYFELPTGSMVTDSWLKIGNQMQQAAIIDRSRANLIYEGIVLRRQDPSILYKNSPTQYELRVFPMAGNEKREVLIKYLVPVSSKGIVISAPLPLNILKTSKYNPFFSVLSYTDSLFQNPALSNVTSFQFQPAVNSAYSFLGNLTALTPAYTEINYTLTNPLRAGIYMVKHATSANDGFYQLAITPSQILNITSLNKVVLMFDYKPNTGIITKGEIFEKARQLLHENLFPSDSFNIMLSGLTISQISNIWLPADSQTIENAFNALSASAITNISNVPTLLGTAIDFVNANGALGDLVLLSNSNDHTTPASANPVISAVQQKIANSNIKINSLLYNTASSYGTWINNNYYYADEYLLSNIAAISGGHFENLAVSSNYSYASYFKTLSDGINALSESLGPRIENFDVRLIMNNGFSYARYSNANSYSVPINKSYVQIGKYHGSDSMELEVTGIYQSIPFIQTIPVSNLLPADSQTRKIWIGRFIETEEAGNPDYSKQNIISDSSIQNRVLSLYTAFLATDPNDTVITCSVCLDETNNNGGGVVSINKIDVDSITIAAMPNPFSDKVKLQVHVNENTKNVLISIYNVMGQQVYMVEPDLENANDFTLEWDGNDRNGDKVAAGIYLLTLQTSASKQTIKLIKR